MSKIQNAVKEALLALKWLDRHAENVFSVYRETVAHIDFLFAGSSNKLKNRLPPVVGHLGNMVVDGSDPDGTCIIMYLLENAFP